MLSLPEQLLGLDLLVAGVFATNDTVVPLIDIMAGKSLKKPPTITLKTRLRGTPDGTRYNCGVIYGSG